jgi:transporter family protein
LNLTIFIFGPPFIIYIVLSGIAGASSWLFYFLALKFKVAQVTPIDKLSVVIVTILAVVFLGEKVSPVNGIGIGLIAIGAILVALG